MRKFLALLLAVTATASLGCATIVTGTKDEVSVSSVPSGAHYIILPTGREGSTPDSVTLKSRRDYVVRFEKECYLPAQGYIDNELSAWTIGNLVIPGWVLWFAVDFGTGGVYRLEDAVAVVMELDPNQCKDQED